MFLFFFLVFKICKRNSERKQHNFIFTISFTDLENVTQRENKVTFI